MESRDVAEAILMIPMAVNAVTATVLKAEEVSDGYGVGREWTAAFTVLATIYPMIKTQAPTEDGLEPVEQVRICFCLKAGQSVHADDRLTAGDATYRLIQVSDFSGSVNCVGTRL